MEESNSKKWGTTLFKLLVYLLPAGVGLSAVTYVYQNYIKDPVIECIPKDESLTFSIDDDFRGIWMRIYPQLMIRYDNQVLLLIHLKGYFEEEVLQFQEDGTCQAVICHGMYAEKLSAYLKENIVKETVAKDSTISREALEEHINIEISSIGGVRYMNKQGNQEKRYCIIETDGLVIDVEADSEQIKDRLDEMELPTGSDLINVGGADLEEIVQVLSKEVIKITKEG